MRCATDLPVSYCLHRQTDTHIHSRSLFHSKSIQINGIYYVYSPRALTNLYGTVTLPLYFFCVCAVFFFPLSGQCVVCDHIRARIITTYMYTFEWNGYGMVLRGVVWWMWVELFFFLFSSSLSVFGSISMLQPFEDHIQCFQKLKWINTTALTIFFDSEWEGGGLLQRFIFAFAIRHIHTHTASNWVLLLYLSQNCITNLNRNSVFNVVSRQWERMEKYFCTFIKGMRPGWKHIMAVSIGSMQIGLIRIIVAADCCCWDLHTCDSFLHAAS